METPSLKICQVNPGCGIEIPPKGWGAIEKIVWEFTTNFQKLGHTVDIKWEEEVQPGIYDSVHVHVANLALSLAEKGVPYVFHFHDHHAYLFGKESSVFKQNLEAIEKSQFSLLPGKFLVDYFGSSKGIYFSHGVNIQEFVPNLNDRPHKLLMLANNGLINDPGYDRKGFKQGIQAASKANLPITIAGPSNNKNFIENNSWVSEHNINWVFDPDLDEVKKLYKQHTVFIHPSELEAGHPNLTILEAMASGLPVVGCMEEDLEGLVRVEKNTDDVFNAVHNLVKKDSNYEEVRRNALVTADSFSWLNRTKELLDLIHPIKMKDILKKEYTITAKSHKPSISKDLIANISFIDGATCELSGNSPLPYSIEFIDTNKGIVDWKDIIGTGMWTKAGKKYYIPWEIKITDNITGKVIGNYKFNCTGKNVRIDFKSSSLGDTLAWIPFVEKFRVKHKCNIYCSTFRNDLLRNAYPNINFIEPGEPSPDIYANYDIGWLYTPDDNPDFSTIPVDFRSIPLQATAAEILGLEFVETKPIIDPGKSTVKVPQGRYVTFSIQSTSQAKYWNRENAWQQLVDWLNSKGVTPVCVDTSISFGGKEQLNHVPDNCLTFPGINLTDISNLISNAELHIGIGSGVSWLAWALDTHTILISGFSEPYSEFTSNCTRIGAKDGVCSGCFNKERIAPYDWMWCPMFKNTERQFECSKSITVEEVISEVNKKLF